MQFIMKYTRLLHIDPSQEYVINKENAICHIIRDVMHIDSSQA